MEHGRNTDEDEEDASSQRAELAHQTVEANTAGIVKTVACCSVFHPWLN